MRLWSADENVKIKEPGMERQRNPRVMSITLFARGLRFATSPAVSFLARKILLRPRRTFG